MFVFFNVTTELLPYINDKDMMVSAVWSFSLIHWTWNRRIVTFVIIHRTPADEGPSKAKCHLYGCCVDVMNQNRQQLFTPGQQREERVQKAGPSSKRPVSSAEEVQRSEGRRGVGAQRKSPKGPKIAADCSPSPSVIHPKCGN